MMAAAVIGLLLAYLVVVAFWLAVDYWDAFEILLYAKSIANSGRYGYSLLRPLLMPVLLAPWFLLERVVPAESFAQTACQVTSVLLFAMLLATFYKLLRLDVAPQWAAVGSLCLGLNPLLIHSAPSVMQDIPATLFLTLAFYWYLTGAESGSVRRWIMAGLFLAMAASTRYNLIPLPFLVIPGYELLSGRIRSEPGTRWLARFLTVFVLACALFWLFPMVVYPLIHVAPSWRAPARFVDDFLEMKRIYEEYPRRPASLNCWFLVESFTSPLVICSIIGFVVAWKHGSSTARFHFLWFAASFVVQTYVVRWKEARYLYPLFPPLYYFVVRGLEATTNFIRQRVSAKAMGPCVSVACVSLALLQPIYLAARECYRFTDPVYRTNFERQVSLYAKECAGDHPIVWLGPFYPVHPREYVFDPEDDFTYVYHFAAHVVRFYTGNPVSVSPQFSSLSVPDAGMTIYPPADVIGSLEDGTVLVVNAEPGGYNTTTLPRELKPLVVQRLRILRFVTVADENGKRTFSAAALPSAKLSVSEADRGYALAGDDLPSNWYYLFADIGGSQPEFVCLGHSNGRRLAGTIPLRLLPAGADMKGLLLYSYDCVKTFAVAQNR